MFWHTNRIAGLSFYLGVWLYAVYPLVKLFAYVAWCHWGAVYLDVKPVSAFKDGLIRFLIGLAFGAMVYLTAVALGPERLSWIYDRIRPSVVFILVFTPIRWVEWWIMEHVMTGKPDRLLLVSRGPLFWRIGGILTSFASDIPLFLFVGFIGAIA